MCAAIAWAHTHPAEGLMRRLVEASRVRILRLSVAGPGGLVESRPELHMELVMTTRGCSWIPLATRRLIPSWRSPHRTLRYSHNPFIISNLREQRNFPFPVPFPISIWAQSHSAGLSGPTGDGWRIGLHPPDGLPAALVPLLELVHSEVAGAVAAVPRRRRGAGPSRPSSSWY